MKQAIIPLFIIFSISLGFGQTVYVDDQRIMRWDQNGEEIKGFGVNYSVPFAHAYRSARKLGIDPLEAIDQDVYHFSRLGFDLYRIHVWDTEISDSVGNLLFNEHLNAFDYLLKKLGERNINYVLTPIAFWGNGWPEPDENTPGFSAKYGKGACLTHPKAIKAQENYLYQFMNHINPYTGIAYKNDPRLLAVEVSNEPHHREEPENVTRFIQRMVDAIRKSGYQNPIFYNVSHSVHLAENYFQADIQGGTFQWYPTGLGYQQELSGNFLPNVDNYRITFDPTIREHKGAKLVYEFDAPDIGKSYIYPAMARSFREAGIQIATHFSYDPMFLAYANTEYNTHFMNLAYTPQKALALKISSEVFHRIPLYKEFGSYPENVQFDDFLVDYDQDLALLNTDHKFYYTNSTRIDPVNKNTLLHIAGSGDSPVVRYNGTGAYFLDKLEPSVWRLEVMPDALVIRNPYGRNNLDKKVAVIQWNVRDMQIDLPDLGPAFNVQPLNDGNDEYSIISEGRSFLISPGVYLLVKKGIETGWDGHDTWGDITLKEFYAPRNSVDRTYLVHKKPNVAIASQPITLQATAISPHSIDKVQIYVSQGFQGRTIDMKESKPFVYEATLPADLINHGFLNYYITVQDGKETVTYPGGNKGVPFQWDFYDRNPYQLKVMKKEQPIYLFNAQEDWSRISSSWWNRDSKLVPVNAWNESEYQIRLDQLYRVDNENLNAPRIYDFTIRGYINQKIDHIREHLHEKESLVLKGRSLSDQALPVQIALVTKDGNSYGSIIEVDTILKEYALSLVDLNLVPTVTMPRPYPTFLPYFFTSKQEKAFEIEDIEGIQISLGPGLDGERLNSTFHLGMVHLFLE